LIEEQHRYKLIVSKESMKCSCDDSSDDFYWIIKYMIFLVHLQHL
jgi:hypothetical protein